MHDAEVQIREIEIKVLSNESEVGQGIQRATDVGTKKSERSCGSKHLWRGQNAHSSESRRKYIRLNESIPELQFSLSEFSVPQEVKVLYV